MSLVIMKFGGTSVGTPQAIQQCAQIVTATLEKFSEVVVVTSALSGVTDTLLHAANQASIGNLVAVEEEVDSLRQRHTKMLDAVAQAGPEKEIARASLAKHLDQFASLCQAVGILGEASPRALDTIASLGERMAILILSEALRTSGVSAIPVEASRLVITDEVYQSATPDMKKTAAQIRAVIPPMLKDRQVPVITGFIGATEKGVITTLGRGGSDYTAAILGVALQADQVWIWTDVDGVMTTDPRIVTQARTIDVLSFREISELAYYGAKVLHPKTIRPVVEAGIELKVLNTFHPDHSGTRIVQDLSPSNGNTIKAVTIIKGLRLITLEGRGMLGVPGVAARTFRSIASTRTSVPLISQASSEQSICFAVPSESTDSVISAIQNEFEREISRRDIDSVWATGEVVIISVVGAGMRSIPGVAGRVFSTLGTEQVNVIAIAQGSSEVSISFIVAAEDGTRAVQALHNLMA
jgi:aspartate kinase